MDPLQIPFDDVAAFASHIHLFAEVNPSLDRNTPWRQTIKTAHTRFD
jgi:hypothetical protein